MTSNRNKPLSDKKGSKELDDFVKTLCERDRSLFEPAVKFKILAFYKKWVLELIGEDEPLVTSSAYDIEQMRKAMAVPIRNQLRVELRAIVEEKS